MLDPTVTCVSTRIGRASLSVAHPFTDVRLRTCLEWQSRTGSAHGTPAEAPARNAQPHAALEVESHPPVWWRDLWALATALAVVPVLFAARQGRLREPGADDFGFLHHALLGRRIDWLGG